MCATALSRRGFNLCCSARRNAAESVVPAARQAQTPPWKGKSMLRQPKNQYVHYKGVILSTSSPNNWYVPKCIGVTDKEDNAPYRKRTPGSVCSGYDCGKRESVRNRRRERPLQKWSELASKLPGKARYPRHRLAAMRGLRCSLPPLGKTFKSAGGEMARMKYRLWFHLDKKTNKTVVRRGSLCRLATKKRGGRKTAPLKPRRS